MCGLRCIVSNCLLQGGSLYGRIIFVPAAGLYLLSSLPTYAVMLTHHNTFPWQRHMCDLVRSVCIYSLDVRRLRFNAVGMAGRKSEWGWVFNRKPSETFHSEMQQNHMPTYAWVIHNMYLIPLSQILSAPTLMISTPQRLEWLWWVYEKQRYLNKWITHCSMGITCFWAHSILPARQNRSRS